MPLLGISGKRGVGKTTLANYIVKYDGFIKLSFADELKKICKLIFPFSDADFTNIKLKESRFKKYDWSPRDFAIHLGEFVRFHDPDYWINATLSRCSDERKFYVIDDVRFKNEAAAIRKEGGKLVRIERFESLNPYGKNLGIPSETDLDSYDKFDYVIEACRNTSLEELCDHEERIMELF